MIKIEYVKTLRPYVGYQGFFKFQHSSLKSSNAQVLAKTRALKKLQLMENVKCVGSAAQVSSQRYASGDRLGLVQTMGIQKTCWRIDGGMILKS